MNQTKANIRADYIHSTRYALQACRNGKAQAQVAYGLTEIQYIFMVVEMSQDDEEPIQLEDVDPSCSWTELFGYETRENHISLVRYLITDSQRRTQWTASDIAMIANRIAWGITYEESGLTPEEIQALRIDEKVREIRKTKFNT